MACEVQLNYLTIPVELIQFVIRNKFEKPLIVFLAFKSLCAGIINEKSLDWSRVSSITGIKSKATLKKHLNILFNLNWVGFNQTTRNYFVRGFNWIRKIHAFPKRTGVRFYINNFSKYKSFFAAAIISYSINKQLYAYKKAGIEKFGKAAFKRVDALQATRIFLKFPAYFGISNASIGKLLNCKKSQANRLKMRAARDKFLTIKKRYKLIAEFEKFDGNIRSYSENSGKLRFKRVRRGGKWKIQLLEQLYDQIISKLEFKRLKRI